MRLRDRLRALRRMILNRRGSIVVPEVEPVPSLHPLDDAAKGEDWHDLLPFSTHRIRLAAERYTMSNGVDPEFDLRTEIVVSESGGDLDGASIVDLGCNEGGFALEFARRGASVLGIEYREISVQRCELARDLMGLDRATFVCGDLGTALPEQTKFDVVFAAGILYHLDQPAQVLARLRAACGGFLLLDTHVADPHDVTHDCSEEVELPAIVGSPYLGRLFGEFTPGSTDHERAQMLWASSTNPTAFWPYEPDLVRMIRDAGFGTITAIDPGERRDRWQVDKTNRVLYLCRP